MGVVGAVLLLAGLHRVAFGQERGPNWSRQAPIPDYYYDAFAPILVSDGSGTIHAFYYIAGRDKFDATVQPGIYYRQWTLTNGWSASNDILLAPHDEPELVLGGVKLDDTGMFHLIVHAGDESRAAVYYSSAPALRAGEAHAWSDLIPIGEDAGPIAAAALASDGKQALVVTYLGKLDGIGLYEVHSADGGKTWSEPVSFYLEGRPYYYPMSINVEMDEFGASTRGVEHI